MKAWAGRLYPFFIALIPILNYAARNPGQYGSGDLALMVAIAVAGCAAIYALAALALRHRGPASLAPFIVLLAVGWAYGYNQAVVTLSGGARPLHALMIVAAVALSVALVSWIRRRDALLVGMGRFLTLMGALLVAYAGIQITNGWLRGRQAIEHSALAARLAQPIPGPATVPGPKRDIYLIVLDEYANSSVLRERFGYDNRPFEDSLRALGFYVPRVVRSNYVHTLLSLPSMLNSAHLVGLEEELGPESTHPALPNHILEHNRVAAYLERRGYRYVFFPSQWWHSTSGSVLADSQFNAWKGFDLTRSLTGGELQRTVRGASILRYLDRDHGWEAAHVRRTLRGVASLPRSDTEPVFAFAHVIKPHNPYVFDGDCETLERGPENDDVGPYLDQVKCLNRMLLATVGRILRESRVEPIIILQGDHGTKLLNATGFRNVNGVTPAAARERVGAFGAYYLPDGGAGEFGDTVTVVNVLGNVLRHYFRADLPRAGDEQYISLAETPYEFRRVDARWLAGDDSAGTALRAGR